MANLLDRFNETVAGSNSKLADYTSIVAPKGDFKRIKDIEVLISSWNNILITPRRTYMFDPEYGSNLYKMIFEPADQSTEEEIIEKVVEALRTYDPRATVKNVSVTFLTSRKGFNVAVEVLYSGQNTELQVVIDENVYFKFLEVAQV